MTIYKFITDDAYRFASEQGIRTRKSGDELQFRSCPYCKAGLRAGEDTWKFSINLKTGQFNCVRGSCGARGNMVTLHKDFGFSLGREADTYYDGMIHFRYIHRDKRTGTKPAAIEYMKSRGISEAVAERYGITTQKEHDNILVFPFEDESGILRFVKYRKTDFDKTKDKNKEWCEKNCMPILFGMAQCNMQNKTLIMTEGQIDSLSVTEAGFENAVSVPTGKNGFTWVPHCWDFLQKFETLIIFGDYERGEISLLHEMESRFHGTVKHVRPEDYKDCKDANDLLRRYGAGAVKTAVNNAEVSPIRELVSLDEVKRCDPSKMESIGSLLPALDKTLGGFYFGQLILVTGERGDGKSTLASQFAVAALAQAHSVFFYSGELPDWYFKSWFDTQCAGPEYITGSRGAYGTTVYTVNEDSLDKVELWYKHRFYLYRNDIELEDERRTLLETMDTAIKQYGCRVLFLDNLMTAMTDNLSQDQYRQQTIFVKALAKMAKRYNVLIFLVAHPRKASTNQFTNDDVAGSSNITNLVDVTLRYCKPKEEDGIVAPRILQILKNRMNGRVHHGSKGIPLFFNEGSKRISEQLNFSWKVGWEGVTEISEEPLPF